MSMHVCYLPSCDPMDVSLLWRATLIGLLSVGEPKGFGKR